MTEHTPVTVPDPTPTPTAQVVLDEDGSSGAFLHGNTTIDLTPVEVYAVDVDAILANAEAQGRKVKVL